MKTMALGLIYVSPWQLPQPESRVIPVAKELVDMCVIVCVCACASV